MTVTSYSEIRTPHITQTSADPNFGRDHSVTSGSAEVTNFQNAAKALKFGAKTGKSDVTRQTGCRIEYESTVPLISLHVHGLSFSMPLNVP
jgi:hypothetical protein